MSVDEIRAAQKAMWGQAASGWAKHADAIEEHNAPITGRMIELAEVAPEDRIVELACGPGTVGIAAATRVDGQADLLLSDVAGPMAEVARDRARAAGLERVEVRSLDLEDIDLPDGSADVVLCRMGLMLVLDPQRAAAEIARVLAPGGRASVATWGPRDRNPWMAAPMDSVGEQFDTEFPPPGVPGPFSIPEQERLGELLAQAGLQDVTTDEVEVLRRPGSLDAWWTEMSELSPVGAMLAAQPDEVQRQIRERAQRAVEPYTTDRGPELPGVAVVAGARRGGA